MERMAEIVPESDEQTLQHFLTYSPWDEREVVDHVARDADRLIGGKRDSCLIIDETSTPKKGDKSVGVSRQWCGTLGKVENCQVAVCAALNHREQVVPIDYRLYLPEEWTRSPQRCRQAGVPDEAIVFKTKHELALEMVYEALDKGVRFNWVGCDGFYGEDPAFLRSLDKKGVIFVADVHKDQRIYLEDPRPMAPESRASKGRPARRLMAQTEPMRVDAWVAAQANESWMRTKVRSTTKGDLVVEALHRRVWVWDGKEEHVKCWHLIVRREINSPHKLKYSLSNAPEEVQLERLLYMQAQRYWVERSFQDAKNECGFSDYQVRKWRGWQHHMALVMMSMLFMLEQRIKHHEELPLLSCSDIAVLLAHTLPRRDIDEAEILRQLEVRHKKRQSAIDSAYRKQLSTGAQNTSETNVTK